MLRPWQTAIVMGAGLWSASPLSEPSTQMTISLLFGMVPARLEPLTGLLGLIGYLRVVSWSIGKAGGRSHDGLCGHRSKVVLQIRILYQTCINGLCAGLCA